MNNITNRYLLFVLQVLKLFFFFKIVFPLFAQAMPVCVFCTDSKLCFATAFLIKNMSRKPDALLPARSMPP